MRNKPFITHEEAVEEYIQDEIFRMNDAYMLGVKDGRKKHQRKRKGKRKHSYIAKGIRNQLPF